MNKKYTVDSCVCDYGIYRDGKLVGEDLIFDSRKNAELVCEIMNLDMDKKVFKYKPSVDEIVINARTLGM